MIDWPLVLGPLLDTPSGAMRGELEQLHAAIFQRARRVVRPRPEVDPLQLPFRTQPVPWFPRARFVANGGPQQQLRPGAFLQHSAGDYYIQDAGSMLAVALCDVKPGQWVCDTCAAPGGKSTALLEALAGDGILVSNEAIAARLGILNLALSRSGYGNQLVTNWDIEPLQRLCGAAFDCVLVDAPCTGQTMVARRKQSMAAFSRAQIEHSSARQMRIIHAAAGLVKNGGRLVYSTCAFSFAENERVVHDFLVEHPAWQPRNLAGLEAWRSPLGDGCYRLWPHRHGCAGAFAALLEKKEQPSSFDAGSKSRSEKIGASRNKRTTVAWQPIDSLPESIPWLTEVEAGQWWRANDELHRFPAAMPGVWIRQALAGTPIAVSKTSRWEPMYGSSTLSNLIVAARNRVELDDEQAIRFVAGEALRYPAEPFDWCIVKWRGRPLAWGKISGGALKNHFPKALRQPNLVCQ